VILAPWLYPDGVAAASWGSRLGVPVWLMALGTDTFHLRHPLRRQAILSAAERAAGIICVWRGLAERLAEAGVARDKLHVVPNGVDAGRFHFVAPPSALQSLPETVPAAWRQASRRALWVGNLVDVKAPERALAALSRLGASLPDAAHLLIVGRGPLLDGLRRQASQAGIAARVHFVGGLPHEVLPAVMNAADVLLLTSRSEGMPNVVLEALACGLPVVATEVGAVGEMLAGEPLARGVAAAGDPAALAEALTDVLQAVGDRPALAARHGQRTWDRMAADVLALLSSARR